PTRRSSDLWLMPSLRARYPNTLHCARVRPRKRSARWLKRWPNSRATSCTRKPKLRLRSMADAQNAKQLPKRDNKPLYQKTKVLELTAGSPEFDGSPVRASATHRGLD